MSLMDHLSAWVEPLLRRPAPAPDIGERRRWQEQQARETAAILRQLRAELHLMRLWRQQDGQ